MGALDVLFAEIEARRSEFLAPTKGSWPRTHPIASDLNVCTREMALAILHWEKRPTISDDLAARFEVGRDQEQATMSKLLRYGFRVVQQQRPFEARGRDGQLLVRGKIDGFFEWQGRQIPFEYKTVTPFIFPKLVDVDSVLRFAFFAKWVRQIWMYEYMNGIETGFLFLDNLLGEWRCVEVPLNLEAVEEILQQCERVVESVALVKSGAAKEEEALPPYHGDISVCRRCWAFGRVCTPPNLDSGPGLRVIDDPAIELMLSRRQELVAAAHEFNDLDTVLKRTFRDIPESICGNFVIRGKVQPRNYKAKPACTVNTWVTTIERIESPAPSETPTPQPATDFSLEG